MAWSNFFYSLREETKTTFSSYARKKKKNKKIVALFIFNIIKRNPYMRLMLFKRGSWVPHIHVICAHSYTDTRKILHVLHAQPFRFIYYWENFFPIYYVTFFLFLFYYMQPHIHAHFLVPQNTVDNKGHII